MGPRRVWTNAAFGRLVWTTFGAVALAISFTVSPADGPAPWHGSQIPADLVICGVAVAVVVGVWTSRLVLSDGVLTATNFYVSRSMRIDEVVAVDWAILPGLGGRVRRHDGTGIRTLVAARTWDELWVPRATKIEREILALAAEARSEHDSE